MSSELEYGDQLLGMRAKLTTYIKSAAVPIRVEVADKMHGPSSVIGLKGGGTGVPCNHCSCPANSHQYLRSTPTSRCEPSNTTLS